MLFCSWYGRHWEEIDFQRNYYTIYEHFSKKFTHKNAIGKNALKFWIGILSMVTHAVHFFSFYQSILQLLKIFLEFTQFLLSFFHHLFIIVPVLINLYWEKNNPIVDILCYSNYGVPLDYIAEVYLNLNEYKRFGRRHYWVSRSECTGLFPVGLQGLTILNILNIGQQIVEIFQEKPWGETRVITIYIHHKAYVIVMSYNWQLLLGILLLY